MPITKSKEMIEFFRLIALPPLERVEQGLPETLVQMTEHLGITYQTITKWHRKAKQMGISKMQVEAPVFTPTLPQSKEEQEKAIFMKQLTIDAAQKGASAPTRTLYATLMKMMPKTSIDVNLGLTADERARRNLTADKQLEEGGFKL